MPQGKKWLLDEKTALAKAFVAASQNPFQGADQTLASFTADLVAKFKLFSPASVDVDDGRFFKRSDSAILDESRSMKKDVQSFNKALAVIWASQPTGTTEDEKLAMAVAIHMKATKRMDYHMKNFDVAKWRNFGAWKILKVLPKFAFSTGATLTDAPSSEDDQHVGAQAETPQGDIENCSENVRRALASDLNPNSAKEARTGKKSAVEQRRREKREKEKEDRKIQHLAHVHATMEQSKECIERLALANEQGILVKKRTANIFTLGSAVMALRGSTNPAAASALADFEAALIKNAHAAIAAEEETNNIASDEE